MRGRCAAATPWRWPASPSASSSRCSPPAPRRAARAGTAASCRSASPTGWSRPRKASARYGDGSYWGDVHLVTFDRLGYDFQGVGEYVVTRDVTGGMEVQSRTAPWRNSRHVSVTKAMAMNVDGDRVAILPRPRAAPLREQIPDRGRPGRSPCPPAAGAGHPPRVPGVLDQWQPGPGQPRCGLHEPRLSWYRRTCAGPGGPPRRFRRSKDDELVTARWADAEQPPDPPGPLQRLRRIVAGPAGGEPVRLLRWRHHRDLHRPFVPRGLGQLRQPHHRARTFAEAPARRRA